MMKKFGFTLSEVLITLGIIGVVAALTAPALVNNTSNAQVGPKLAKAVSTVENANRKILMDAAVTDLRQVGTTIDDYIEKLSEQISGSTYDTTELKDSDFSPAPTSYDKSSSLSILHKHIKLPDNTVLFLWEDGTSYTNYNAKSSYKGRAYALWVDINGIKTAPNRLGIDIFAFYIDRNGSVIPQGGSTYVWLMNGYELWSYESSSSASSYACNENGVGDGIGCAGSIFDNNLKVIYR